MLYFAYLEDIEDIVAIREPLLEAHMKHIGAYIERIKPVGPLMRADGTTQADGVWLIEAESEDEVPRDRQSQSVLPGRIVAGRRNSCFQRDR